MSNPCLVRLESLANGQNNDESKLESAYPSQAKVFSTRDYNKKVLQRFRSEMSFNPKNFIFRNSIDIDYVSDKISVLDKSLLVLLIMFTLLIFTYLEYSYESRLEGMKKYIEYALLANVVLTAAFVIFKYKVTFEFSKVRMIISEDTKFAETHLLWEAVSEVLLNLLHPNSLFGSITYSVYNSSVDLHVIYSINDIICVVSIVVKAYYILKQTMLSLEFTCNKMQRLVNLFGGEDFGFFFGFKIFMIRHPQRFIWYSLIGTLTFFSFIIRILEMPVQVIVKNPMMKNWDDIFWFSIITMSTIGYGDRVPMTLPARFATFLMMIWGSIWTSLFISTLYSIFNLNEHEIRALNLFHRTSIRTTLEQKAAYVIADLMKINKQLVKNFKKMSVDSLEGVSEIQSLQKRAILNLKEVKQLRRRLDRYKLETLYFEDDMISKLDRIKNSEKEAINDVLKTEELYKRTFLDSGILRVVPLNPLYKYNDSQGPTTMSRSENLVVYGYPRIEVKFAICKTELCFYNKEKLLKAVASGKFKLALGTYVENFSSDFIVSHSLPVNNYESDFIKNKYKEAKPTVSRKHTSIVPTSSVRIVRSRVGGLGDQPLNNETNREIEDYDFIMKQPEQNLESPTFKRPEEKSKAVESMRKERKDSSDTSPFSNNEHSNSSTAKGSNKLNEIVPSEAGRFTQNAREDAPKNSQMANMTINYEHSASIPDRSKVGKELKPILKKQSTVKQPSYIQEPQPLQQTDIVEFKLSPSKDGALKRLEDRVGRSDPLAHIEKIEHTPNFAIELVPRKISSNMPSPLNVPTPENSTPPRNDPLQFTDTSKPKEPIQITPFGSKELRERQTPRLYKGASKESDIWKEMNYMQESSPLQTFTIRYQDSPRASNQLRQLLRQPSALERAGKEIVNLIPEQPSMQTIPATQNSMATLGPENTFTFGNKTVYPLDLQTVKRETKPYLEKRLDSLQEILEQSESDNFKSQLRHQREITIKPRKSPSQKPDEVADANGKIGELFGEIERAEAYAIDFKHPVLYRRRSQQVSGNFNLAKFNIKESDRGAENSFPKVNSDTSQPERPTSMRRSTSTPLAYKTQTFPFSPPHHSVDEQVAPTLQPLPSTTPLKVHHNKSIPTNTNTHSSLLRADSITS